MKIINNQRGNITLLGFFFLFASFALITISIFRENKAYKEVAQDLKEQLCLKKMIKDKTTYIKRIELINLSLKATFATQMVTIAIPGLQVISASAENIKKALKAAQQVLAFSEMKNEYQRFRKGCPFSLSQAKTPYKHRLFYLTRDFTQSAQLRSLKWKEVWIGKNSTYKLNFQVSGIETKVSSQRIRL